MFWAILISVWGGFLLGVILMAVLSMTREDRAAKTEDLTLENIVPDTREPEIKVMHG